MENINADKGMSNNQSNMLETESPTQRENDYRLYTNNVEEDDENNVEQDDEKIVTNKLDDNADNSASDNDHVAKGEPLCSVRLYPRQHHS